MKAASAAFFIYAIDFHHDLVKINATEGGKANAAK